MLIATVGFGMSIFMNNRINYKYLVEARMGWNVFRIYNWWVEIIQFPMLAALMKTGTCNYESQKQAIKVVQCFQKENWTWFTENADG